MVDYLARQLSKEVIATTPSDVSLLEWLESGDDHRFSSEGWYRAGFKGAAGTAQ
jgi:hypothetical protein